MTTPTDVEPDTLVEPDAPPDIAIETEPSQQSTKRPKSRRRLGKNDTVTIGDLRAGLSGEQPLPTVDPTSKPAPQSDDTSDGDGKRNVLHWLADASHWLPLDEDAVNIPSIRTLTDDHRDRVNRSSSKITRGAGKAVAAGTLLIGYSLNLASLVVASISTALNRACVSKEAWTTEDGTKLRPRSLATLSTDNAARAVKIQNRWARAHFLFVSGLVRRIGQILNPIAHDLAWIAAGMNDPRRAGDALTVAGTVTAVLVGVWWVVS